MNLFKTHILLITGVVAMILIRTLRRDIANYNKEDELVLDFHLYSPSNIDINIDIMIHHSQ